MSDKIMIDDELDAMSEGQLLVITARAVRKLGYWAEFTPDGTLQIDEDVEYESDEFFEAWEHEACLMVATQMTAQLVNDRKLYVDGVDEDGNFIFKPVPGALEDHDG